MRGPSDRQVIVISSGKLQTKKIKKPRGISEGSRGALKPRRPPAPPSPPRSSLARLPSVCFHLVGRAARQTPETRRLPPSSQQPYQPLSVRIAPTGPTGFRTRHFRTGERRSPLIGRSPGRTSREPSRRKARCRPLELGGMMACRRARGGPRGGVGYSGSSEDFWGEQ